MKYFSHPAVSNSNLKALARMYYALQKIDSAAAFRFGLLVDCILTEEWKLTDNCIEDEDGRIVRYTDQEISLAKRMANTVQADPVVRLLIPGGEGQRIFIREMPIVFEGREFTLEVRCKFDWYNSGLNTGVDYKTTACANYKTFKESIEFFDYDQAAAFYMDIAEIDFFWIIGISKKNGQVFKFAIQRGDSVYEAGKRKYVYWCNKWDILIPTMEKVDTNQ